MSRRIAIVGSRHYNPAELINDRLEGMIETYGIAIVVVSGGEPTGVDTTARVVAETLGLEVVEHLPKRRVREEFFARNTLIANDCDELWAFFAPGERSPGTSDTLAKAKARGVPVYVHHNGKWLRERPSRQLQDHMNNFHLGHLSDFCPTCQRLLD